MNHRPILPSVSDDSFVARHIGPSPDEIAAMLKVTRHASLDELTGQAVPAAIRLRQPLQLPPPRGEQRALADLRATMNRNQVFRSYIGTGYSTCFTPPVIQRNILENPGWYTAYTPYQAEIAQGRLEALLNFQTMITDLTGMDIANASLLDEGTAAAEAMTLSWSLRKNPAASQFFVSDACHPQTIAVVRTRARPLGIEVIVGDGRQVNWAATFGALVQYPDTYGAIPNYAALFDEAHRHSSLCVVAADLLSLVLLKPPGEFGADVVVGSAQRFGVPMGFGGPHAAFFATRDAYKRNMPGRLVGVSRDAQGHRALRLSLQTREQHIRREKATSNICTAQVLLAVIASMYAVYHGPAGLRRIAGRVNNLTGQLARGLQQLGRKVLNDTFFDTLRVAADDSILHAAEARRINLRRFPDSTVGISLDETTTEADVVELLSVFNNGRAPELPAVSVGMGLPADLRRTSDFLTHPVFNRHHTETEMLRYLQRLESKDLALNRSMIPLGSCTMKLNATAEMMPITWPEIAGIHPFAPAEQTEGYRQMFADLEAWLAEITGFAAVSLQPNAGSQGEYTGLLVIRQHHLERGDKHRDVCLIPVSAHGTNPASAAMAGMRVVAVACDALGNIDLTDLKKKAETHRATLAAVMVTYPSTHGVFEETIRDVCRVVHENGGQVYMDGANMNAQVGLCRPGDMGADVCHLNLHKTFCIPHGGGGPGMGPICVAGHLAKFLPGREGTGIGAVSSAPWGSASILPISWMYIAMMGADGLTRATQVAILNANYVARRLEGYFPVLYKGPSGLVAHECIIDLRSWKAAAGIEVEDVAKRLMDFGFHAPTMSWPVPGTLMIEPTESESKEELDRFCEAMIAIHGEMKAVESGAIDRQNNPLKNAPHTARMVTEDDWQRPYSRRQAAFPVRWLEEGKFWPPVGRIDNVYGDRNLFCTCAPVEMAET